MSLSSAMSTPAAATLGCRCAAAAPAHRTMIANMSMRDRAYAGLRELLIAGQLAPGDRLSARELAGNLKMSPMPVREALQRLVADGAVEVRPQSGARVPLMTRERFVELRDIRIALEGMAVQRAATRLTLHELRTVRACHMRFLTSARRRHPDPAIVIRANQQLHFAVYAAARLPTLYGIIEGLWLQIGPILNLDLRGSPQRLRATAAHEHHAKLVAALSSRDGPAARRALVGDITSAAAYILSLRQLPETVSDE